MLDDGIKQLLEHIYASKRTPWNQIPLFALRRSLLKAIKGHDMAPIELPEVINTQTDTGIAVRIYRPRLDAQLPALMYLHGGGWVTLDLESHDPFCRHLAKAADCIVVAVDFRQAPEHRFPAGIEDAVAAYLWLHSQLDALNIDPTRVGIGGDSTGANIAMAVSALLQSDQAIKPVLQFLAYPVTDVTRQTESRQQFSKGYGFDHHELDFFEKNYFNHPGERSDWRVSPLLIENVSFYPPTLLFTAGFDPLRDEGQAMADKMRQQGVAVTYRCFDDQIHGFLQMGSVPTAMNAINEVAQTLGDAWQKLK